jgi:hypothetical protein
VNGKSTKSATDFKVNAINEEIEKMSESIRSKRSEMQAKEIVVV